MKKIKFCQLCGADTDSIDLYSELDKIIGSGYYFNEMCSWARDLSGPSCHHHDCIKAYWINKTNRHIRDEIKKLLKKS